MRRGTVKRILWAVLLVLMSISAVPFSAQPIAADDPIKVTGGSVYYDFSAEEQLDEFALYSHTGVQPYWMEGAIATVPTGVEQKLLLPLVWEGDVEVAVRIRPLAENYLLDGGIYVGASQASNGLDMINALCVNAEKPAYSNDVTIKLHAFSWGYDGCLTEQTLRGLGQDVRLRVVIKGSLLYAYANDRLAFSYEMENYSGGMVGLRSFYCAQSFDELTVTHATLPLDVRPVERELALFDALEASDWTESSYRALATAVASVRARELTSAWEVEQAAKQLRALSDALVRRVTKTELLALAELCRELTAADFTTNNAYRSMQSLLARAEAAEATDERELAEVYHFLTLVKTEGTV